VAAPSLDCAGVNGDPHGQSSDRSPVFGSERSVSVDRRCDRVGRARESRVYGVADRFEDDSMAAAHDLLEQGVVPSQRIAHRRTMALEELRRTLDIAEEEGHRTFRHAGHQCDGGATAQ